MATELTQRQKMILDLVKTQGPISRAQITRVLPQSVSKTTVLRDLRLLITSGLIIKQGTNQDIVYTTLGASGSTVSQVQPPSAQTNTSTPEKKPSFITKETSETKVKASLTGEDPITAFIVVLGIGTVGFGVGRLTSIISNSPLRETPIYKYFPQPTPTPDPWRETAFTGTVRYSDLNKVFYLITTQESEAILLTLPKNIDLTPYMYRRIFATSHYNGFTNTLHVTEASDLELQ